MEKDESANRSGSGIDLEPKNCKETREDFLREEAIEFFKLQRK